LGAGQLRDALDWRRASLWQMVPIAAGPGVEDEEFVFLGEDDLAVVE
jgi:hypothetical protein